MEKEEGEGGWAVQGAEEGCWDGWGNMKSVGMLMVLCVKWFRKYASLGIVRAYHITITVYLQS